MLRFVLTAVCLLAAAPVQAGALVPVEVAPDVYAIVGPLGPRDPDNLGNNATFGLVVTEDGAVLIDPGGSREGAEALHDVVRSLTDQPVAVVIDTGGQDQRWLGNDYWHEQGAEIVAAEAAVADQTARASMQMTALAELIGPAGLEGTEPRFADVTFADRIGLNRGGVDFELIRSPGHTPGDTVVWLPGPRVVFTGDLVYTDRLLGVIDVSSSRDWLASFETMAALDPAVVVPGHGAPTDLAKATGETYDYLVALRTGVGALIESGADILSVSEIDQSAFSGLANFDSLAGRNAQAVYAEMEWE